MEMLGTYEVCSVSLLHPPVSRLGKQGNEEHLVPPQVRPAPPREAVNGEHWVPRELY